MPTYAVDASSVQPMTALIWLVSFVGFAGLAALARFGYKRYKVAREKVVEAWGDLFGRDPVLHPNTDEEILPATPGIGARITMLERGQEKATEALQQIARTQSELVQIHHRIDEETEQRELLAVEFERHRDELAERDRQRKIEREREVEMRAETERQMWSAIEAVAKASPSAYGE